MPTNGATDVTLDSNVTINFNDDVDCTTVNTTTITSDSPSWALSICSGSQAVFATSGQASSTTYNVNVTTAVEDLAGNPMASPYPFSYTTAGAGDSTPPIFGGLTGATDAGTGGTVDLTWSAASDPSTPITYNIYYATTSGGQNFGTPGATSSSGTGYTVSGLTDDQIYYFVVRAEDSLGNEDTNTVEASATPTGGSGPVDADDDGYDETVDCNDGDPSINPGAEEDCTDLIDNDCDNLIDAQDPDAVGCPVTCTDGDGDTYNVETQNCGAVDCDDSDASINPGAVEDCTDYIDNDCDNNTDCADSACTDDPACQSSGTCSDYTSKGACNEDPNCAWSGNPRTGSCGDDGGGDPPSNCSDYDGTDKATCEANNCRWNKKKLTCN